MLAAIEVGAIAAKELLNVELGLSASLGLNNNCLREWTTSLPVALRNHERAVASHWIH